jgi:hypothetical protein
MKYNLIDPENKNLLELKEYASEIILEICDMMPGEVKRYLSLIENALQKNNLSDLLFSLHAMRRNFEYFIIRTLPQYKLMIELEYDLQELVHKQNNNQEVSFSPDRIAEIESIRQFANEFLTEVEIYVRNYREELGN